MANEPFFPSLIPDPRPRGVMLVKAGERLRPGQLVVLDEEGKAHPQRIPGPLKLVSAIDADTGEALAIMSDGRIVKDTDEPQ